MFSLKLLVVNNKAGFGRELTFFWLSRFRTENYRDIILQSRNRPDYRIYRNSGIPDFVGRFRSVMNLPKVRMNLQISHRPNNKNDPLFPNFQRANIYDKKKKQKIEPTAQQQKVLSPPAVLLAFTILDLSAGLKPLQSAALLRSMAVTFFDLKLPILSTNQRRASRLPRFVRKLRRSYPLRTPRPLRARTLSPSILVLLQLEPAAFLNSVHGTRFTTNSFKMRGSIYGC